MGATTGRGLFVRTKEASIMSALVKENEIERGLAALFVEAERVARFGFAETELDRQKTNMLRSYERAVAERENQQSAALAGEFVRNFLHDEPIPGIELEYELVGRFLPDISLDEVNDLARGWAPDGNRVVLVSAPEKDGLEIPDEASLAAVIAAVEELEIEPYVDEAANAPLLDVMPSPGAIVEATPRDEFGITEWTLSNGVRVVLMPTTFKDDEIVFRAFSPGGTSLASDENFIPARTATQVVTASGVGAFSMIDLRKKLTGKVASARPTIGPLDEGVSGGASKQDLETMFQLIYLTFTQPRADVEIFDVIISQTRALLANQTATPAFAFNKTLNDTMSQNHPRARITTPETMDEMDLDGSLAFYRERFADASDFTFIFAGSFELAEIQPFVVRYLATLPSIGRSETWRDEGIHPPTGVVEKVVEKGLEPQSQTAIVFTGPFDYTREGRVAIRAMASILQTRLRETLREDLGGTYSVSASPSYVRIPREEYRLNIRFGSDPDRADALSATVFEEIAKLKTDGPTEQEVRDAIEAIVRDYETNMESNNYLVSQLYFKYRDEADVAELFDAVDFYRGLGIAPVHDAARRYLNTDNYVKVVLMPESGGVR
jgi:zinc protease